ncbi:MAG TPA: efflux RND transporter permease subunit, partial [Phycisphaerae bacterium]|nr:efflux RND transporter permease subunit [Phycisphaerae bacterium]
GANVIEAMEGLKEAITAANKEVLEPKGLKLDLTQVYDETTYIHSAIELVKSNIYWGGLLTILVLFFYLRSLSATFIIAVSIPICIIGTFLIIPAFNRSINVVLLAGLAFAVGMVVDCAIVVLENIFRHREMGKSAMQAASDGASEVWGAVLANTLTTIVVFLPIVFVQEEAGQLFKDIAIAIAGSMALALLVAIAVVPVMCSKMLRRTKYVDEMQVSGIARRLGDTVRWMNRSTIARLAVVLGMTGGSIALSIALAPPQTYLPSGNRNLIFGFLITPPGYNVAEFQRIGRELEDGNDSKGLIGIRPFWEARRGTPEFAQLMERWQNIVEQYGVGPLDGQIKQQEAVLADAKSKRAERKSARQRIRELKRQIAEWRVPPPPIQDFFYVAFNGTCFMGCSSADEASIKPLTNVLASSGFGIPDAFPIFFQVSIFPGDPGSTLDLEVRGDDLDTVIRAAQDLKSACTQRFGYVEANPQKFDAERREDQFVPDRVKAGDVGLTTADIGSIIRACGDGRVVGQYREGGQSIDLAVKVIGTQDDLTGLSTSEAVSAVPIYTPTGKIVPLSSVCRMDRTTAPEQIRHIENQQAVKLTVRPPEGVRLPDAMNIIENEIVGPMRAEGYGETKIKLPSSITVNLAGNADKLVTTWNSLKWLLLLSFLVCFLVMAGLFESFAYPFVIILSVPPAVVGGFVGLWLVHQWTWNNPAMAVQELDILTILGFVILLGTVVNNGVLIVHQALNFIRDGMEGNEAIALSVATRWRPIMMTVITTLVGELLLVIRPGSGAEMYRGIGAVVLGGLTLSTLFTMLVVPAMLSLFIGARVRLGRFAFGRREVVPVPARFPQPEVRGAFPVVPAVAPVEERV